MNLIWQTAFSYRKDSPIGGWIMLVNHSETGEVSILFS